MYGIALAITVTLIFFTILFLPVSIRFELSDNKIITLDLTLFAIVFSNRYSRKNKETKSPKRLSIIKNKSRVKDAANFALILLKHTHVEVKGIKLADSDSLLKGNLSIPFLFAAVSILLTIISNQAKSFKIVSSDYLLTHRGAGNMAIDITFSFFLYDLFIVTLKVLYLKISKQIRRKLHDKL